MAIASALGLDYRLSVFIDSRLLRFPFLSSLEPVFGLSGNGATDRRSHRRQLGRRPVHQLHFHHRLGYRCDLAMARLGGLQAKTAVLNNPLAEFVDFYHLQRHSGIQDRSVALARLGFIRRFGIALVVQAREKSCAETA